jgi:hypothetical protein
MAKGYDPPRELVEFIEAGEPPVYIGWVAQNWINELV